MLTAKSRQIALVLRAGRVTLRYPAEPHPPAEGFRGLPTIDGARCAGCGACAHVCPARLIKLTEYEDRFVLEAEFARCTYCARCAEVCPTGAFQMTDRFETAVTDPGQLTARVELAMGRCTACGRPTGTPQQMTSVLAEQLGLAPHLAGLCSACRRRNYGETLKGGVRRG